MAILLLIGAIICWLVAGIPGFVTIAVGRVDFGWFGMFLFGLWLLLSGAPSLLAFVQARRTPQI